MATTVILIRHALPKREGNEGDFSRPLSETGKSVQKKMNQFLKHRGIIPDAIWHSPFKRTEETAELIGQDFQIMPAVELALGEFFDEEELLAKLPASGENFCIFMVGHGPSLMRFATYLVGEQCYVVSPSCSSALEIAFHGIIAAGKGEYVRYYSPESDLAGFNER